MPKKDFSYSIPWNLFLILVGVTIQAIGFKAISDQQHFIPAGIFGLATFLKYTVGTFGISVWFTLLNIPLFIAGYIYLKKRFVLYSLFAMVTLTLIYSYFPYVFHIQNQLYAAVAFGSLYGFGGGIVLRSLGSNGGLDIAAVILHQRFNFGIGRVYFYYNFILFSASFICFDNDLIIASMIAAFVTSVVMEYALSMFSQRKLCYIISENNDDISSNILKKLNIGATLIPGKGVYSGKNRNVLMVVINNIQLKRLEEIVYKLDEEALFIVENTFTVIGSNFSKRKVY